MDDFETELARMMRDTQDITPLTDEQRARLRGGVRKRRQTRTAWIAGGSVAVVAGLAAVLPSAFAAAPAGATRPVTTAASSTPVPSPTTGGGTAWMQDYVARTFKSLLPAGSSTKAWSQYGGVPFRVSAPTLSASGTWDARVQTDLTTPGGRSTTGLTVKASAPTAHCPTTAGTPFDTCTTTSRDGGTLVVDRSFKNPVNGTGASIWTVSWNGPDGQLVTFSEATDQPHQALTVQQAEALVSAPAWNKVGHALPASCQFGAMIAPGATAAQMNSGQGLVCATSPGVAIHAPTIATAFTITSTTTTPVDARTADEILASCLGSDASAYRAVIAVRTPVSTKDWDGAVVAVNSAGQYVQCEAKGHQGTSPDVPPTFIHNRMWSPGHVIEFFDSVGEPVSGGQYLSLGAGHYASDVAKITVSYGDNPTQYPAIMAGGAYFYTAAISTGTTDSSSSVVAPDPHIHAYSASGTLLYNQ